MKPTCHVTGPRVPGTSIPNSTVINKKSTAAATSPAWNIVPSGKRSEDSGDQRFARGDGVPAHLRGGRRHGRRGVQRVPGEPRGRGAERGAGEVRPHLPRGLP